MNTTEKLCVSVKSRKYKNLQCPYPATHGEFCHRHYKNPLRFLSNKTECDHVHTRSEHCAARKIQHFWRVAYPLYVRRCHGPAIHIRTLSSNDTEFYSLDTISKIPRHYFFSYLDSKSICWAFDIRSLNHLLLQDTCLKNPYTREEIPAAHMKKLKGRIHLLTLQKVPLFYNMKENLTQKQIWDQRVLEIFLKMDSLGYRASTQWFEKLTLLQHERFFKQMFLLWTVRLGLTPAEKTSLIPGFNNPLTKLFLHTPDQLQSKSHDLVWWKKQNLELIRKFISTAEDKTKQSLGALYVLMGLFAVVPEVGDAYPWIRDV